MILNKLKKAFTLAEVLLSMTIIGIIAALTIPTLMLNTKKAEIGSKLSKFYTMMNQAIEIAENETDSFTSEWKYNISNNEFLNTYLAPYLKGEVDGDYYRFSDGSEMLINKNGSDCKKVQFYISGHENNSKSGDGKFAFFICKNLEEGGLTTYSEDTDKQKSRDDILKACSSSPEIYCARLIQMSGWKVPDDYPFDDL